MCEQVLIMLMIAIAVSVSSSWLYSASKKKTAGGIYANAFAAFLFALTAAAGYTLLDKQFFVPSAIGDIILFAAAWWASDRGAK